MTVRIEISCPVLNPSNEAFAEQWRDHDPAWRQACADALGERGIFAGDLDINSDYAPTFIYPAWHACAAQGGNGSGSDPGGILARDEGERMRAAALARGTGDETTAGVIPIPGLGLFGTPISWDWLKWLAWAAVIAGGAYLVLKKRQGKSGGARR